MIGNVYGSAKTSKLFCEDSLINEVVYFMSGCNYGVPEIEFQNLPSTNKIW